MGNPSTKTFIIVTVNNAMSNEAPLAMHILPFLVRKTMLHIAAKHPCYDKDVNQHTLGL